MYTRGLLQRYGAAIEDEATKEVFLARIGEIEFPNDAETAACSGGEVERVLTGTEAVHLVADLARNHIRFLTDEDLQGLPGSL